MCGAGPDEKAFWGPAISPGETSFCPRGGAAKPASQGHALPLLSRSHAHQRAQQGRVRHPPQDSEAQGVVGSSCLSVLGRALLREGFALGGPGTGPLLLGLPAQCPLELPGIWATSGQSWPVTEWLGGVGRCWPLCSALPRGGESTGSLSSQTALPGRGALDQGWGAPGRDRGRCWLSWLCSVRPRGATGPESAKVGLRWDLGGGVPVPVSS